MYGELKAFYKSWGNEGDPPGTSYYQIKTRPCTREEIGLGENKENSRFYPAKKESMSSVEDYADKLQCIDEDIVVKGTDQSLSAQLLSIQFVACDYINNSTCKSYEEIRQFMRRKFVITYENQSIFKLDKYDHRKITRESNLVWHPMNTVLKQETVTQVHISEVTMQDKYFRAGDLTKEQSLMVHSILTTTRPMEYNNLHQFGVVFQINLDFIQYERQVYGILDWLSDCGGLSSALFAILSIASKILMYQLLDYYMVKCLYTKQELESSIRSEDQKEGGS